MSIFQAERSERFATLHPAVRAVLESIPFPWTAEETSGAFALMLKRCRSKAQEKRRDATSCRQWGACVPVEYAARQAEADALDAAADALDAYATESERKVNAARS